MAKPEERASLTFTPLVSYAIQLSSELNVPSATFFINFFSSFSLSSTLEALGAVETPFSTAYDSLNLSKKE